MDRSVFGHRKVEHLGRWRFGIGQAGRSAGKNLPKLHETASLPKEIGFRYNWHNRTERFGHNKYTNCTCTTSLLSYEPIAGSVDMRPYQRGKWMSAKMAKQWQEKQAEWLFDIIWRTGTKAMSSRRGKKQQMISWDVDCPTRQCRWTFAQEGPDPSQRPQDISSKHQESKQHKQDRNHDRIVMEIMLE